MHDDGLERYEKDLFSSSSAVIRADGKEYEADYLNEPTSNLMLLKYNPLEFYILVDLFASQYGMGGCKSLEEYANMIDQQDPVLIEAMKYAMLQRNRAECGEDTRATEVSGSVGTRRSGFKKKWGEDDSMGDFLANSGIPIAEIREAKSKLASGKINKEEDEKFHKWLYSTVTPEKLRDPNFDLKKTHARIKEYLSKTETFVITKDKIFGNRKNAIS
jgi:hypothetical protein